MAELRVGFLGNLSSPPGLPILGFAIKCYHKIMSQIKKRLQVLEYNAVFQQETDGGFSVWVPSLPGCTSQGDTFETAVANIKEAIALY